jgi:hypothetical protein
MPSSQRILQFPSAIQASQALSNSVSTNPSLDKGRTSRIRIPTLKKREMGELSFSFKESLAITNMK